MENLSDLWFNVCEELWELSEDRPYVRSVATVWDAFKFMYMRRVNGDKTNGRKVYGEVK